MDQGHKTITPAQQAAIDALMNDTSMGKGNPTSSSPDNGPEGGQALQTKVEALLGGGSEKAPASSTNTQTSEAEKLSSDTTSSSAVTSHTIPKSTPKPAPSPRVDTMITLIDCTIDHVIALQVAIDLAKIKKDRVPNNTLMPGVSRGLAIGGKVMANKVMMGVGKDIVKPEELKALSVCGPVEVLSQVQVVNMDEGFVLIGDTSSVQHTATYAKTALASQLKINPESIVVEWTCNSGDPTLGHPEVKDHKHLIAKALDLLDDVLARYIDAAYDGEAKVEDVVSAALKEKEQSAIKDAIAKDITSQAKHSLQEKAQNSEAVKKANAKQTGTDPHHAIGGPGLSPKQGGDATAPTVNKSGTLANNMTSGPSSTSAKTDAIIKKQAKMDLLKASEGNKLDKKTRSEDELALLALMGLGTAPAKGKNKISTGPGPVAPAPTHQDLPAKKSTRSSKKAPAQIITEVAPLWTTNVSAIGQVSYLLAKGLEEDDIKHTLRFSIDMANAVVSPAEALSELKASRGEDVANDLKEASTLTSAAINALTKGVNSVEAAVNELRSMSKAFMVPGIPVQRLLIAAQVGKSTKKVIKDSLSDDEAAQLTLANTKAAMEAIITT